MGSRDFHVVSTCACYQGIFLLVSVIWSIKSVWYVVRCTTYSCSWGHSHNVCSKSVYSNFRRIHLMHLTCILIHTLGYWITVNKNYLGEPVEYWLHLQCFLWETSFYILEIHPKPIICQQLKQVWSTWVVFVWFTKGGELNIDSALACRSVVKIYSCGTLISCTCMLWGVILGPIPVIILMLTSPSTPSHLFSLVSFQLYLP